ncbi:MAG: sulfite exporter TauE/SafE family protein [Psychroflexus halocasei]
MLWSAFILGFLGSLHCVGMCGPIALMLPVSRTNQSLKFLQILLYNSGRILTYMTIGLLFGLLGESIASFGFQQHLSIAIGAIMLLSVLIPQKFLSRFKISQPFYRAITKIKVQLGASFKKKSLDTFFSIGFLNGFLPCGLVYMAVFGSVATGDLIDGSLYMALFGLGTLPMMTFVIYLKSFTQNVLKLNLKKIIPYAVGLIGVLFILRGMGLGIPYVSPKPVNQKVESNMECY